MKSRERAKMEAEITKILEASRSVLKGHFVGTSGNHLDTYVNKNDVSVNPEDVSRIGHFMAKLFKDKGIEAVVGPATAGIPFSQMTALHLQRMTRKKVLSLYTDKEGDNQVWKRGYDKKVAGMRVLAVEDVLTTGGSLKQVVELIKKAGGIPVGATALVNRDSTLVTSDSVGAPLDALLNFQLKSYKEGEVPEWLQKIPINTEVGHGKEYLAGKKTS